MTTSTRSPHITRAGDGEARWWFASLAEILLPHDATGGALSIVQVTEPPGAGAPLHVHHHDDETFVVLEGAVTFEVGGETHPRRRRATSSSAPAPSPTATTSAPTAAACCSSSPPAGASTRWSAR